jgi:hypothetical protein
MLAVNYLVYQRWFSKTSAIASDSPTISPFEGRRWRALGDNRGRLK